jgi:hypothetical protein
MEKQTSWYTFGRVLSHPTERQTRTGRKYRTVYVELFGGLRASALAGDQQLATGDYIGVKITPKSDGQAAYHTMPLNDAAEDMLRGAVSYLHGTPTTPVTQASDDDVPELPF